MEDVAAIYWFMLSKLPPHIPFLLRAQRKLDVSVAKSLCTKEQSNPLTRLLPTIDKLYQQQTITTSGNWFTAVRFGFSRTLVLNACRVCAVYLITSDFFDVSTLSIIYCVGTLLESVVGTWCTVINLFQIGSGVIPFALRYLWKLYNYITGIMSSSEESFEHSSSLDLCSGDNDIVSSIPHLSDVRFIC